MAEYDNSGFPLTYCLLSTATAIDHQKRIKALAAWTKCLRDKYGINPIFAHVDKDMAEIGCLRQVRLAKAKLSTTPYNAKRAHAEFSFIDEKFIPPGTQVDVADYEGGPPEDADLVLACPGPMPTSANAPPMSNAPQGPIRILGDTTNILRIKIPLPSQVAPARSSAATRIIQGNGFTLRVLKSIAPADFEDNFAPPTTASQLSI
jgi:hypothetical protein